MRTVGREFLDKFAQQHKNNEHVRTGGSPDSYFSILERRFPLVGSKIAWSQAPNSVMRETDSQDSERYARDAVKMLSDVVKAEGMADEQIVIAIGDSLMEDVVSLPLGILRESLSEFLELPQHLYVLPEDGSWCFSFTMEGDLAFGHAPAP